MKRLSREKAIRPQRAALVIKKTASVARARRRDWNDKGRLTRMQEMHAVLPSLGESYRARLATGRRNGTETNRKPGSG